MAEAAVAVPGRVERLECEKTGRRGDGEGENAFLVRKTEREMFAWERVLQSSMRA
jgi:hypothetical protein